MRAYQRARPAIKTVEAARRWEHIYVAGAATSIALLGLWCYLAFARTSDPFTQLVSFSMTIAYTTGIFGRNFGSARFVVVQIFCAWAPITAALLIYGNIFHWIFAGLLVPAFLALKFIADRLRSTLLDAVVSSRDMSLLAKRFDTAINNMPHGLCMFDSKRRVVVSNGKLKQQLGLASDLELKGLCVREEFVILQAPIKSLEQGEALATRVLNALAGTCDLDGHKVVVTASIGIALAKSRIDPEQLLRNADIALSQAKADGRGTFRWFEAKMEASAQARRALELDLRSATESEAFELYYQPIFNLKTRRIETCEALLRWPHHERGMVSPSEFIPVAEEMGLIVEIGNQALYKACLECRRWPGDTAVAVNLSSIQFDRSNVPALVRETLAATNLPAHRLEIEITETTLLQNTRRTRADLHQLAEIGVKISLDDFGTAYSSLSYLHSFPFHKVKIDQSFLQDLSDDQRRITLLRGMTRLSAQLGLRVVVEGVETEEQLELLLAEESIDEVQGYLLCRPMPAADLRKLLYATYVSPPQKSPWPARVRSDAA